MRLDVMKGISAAAPGTCATRPPTGWRQAISASRAYATGDAAVAALLALGITPKLATPRQWLVVPEAPPYPMDGTIEC